MKLQHIYIYIIIYTTLLPFPQTLIKVLIKNLNCDLGTKSQLCEDLPDFEEKTQTKTKQADVNMPAMSHERKDCGSHFAALLGASWTLLRCSWGALRASWEALAALSGASCGPLADLFALLGVFLGPLRLLLHTQTYM